MLDADERDMRRPCAANEITMIFQEPMTSLNPLHTIEQQIGEILRRPPRHERVEQARGAHPGTDEPGGYPRSGEGVLTPIRISFPAGSASAS